MKLLTIIYAYYDNPTMFCLQLENWKSYQQEIKEMLDFIVVDDCSPRWPAKSCGPFFFNHRIYRMKEDIPWNMDACRNLAVSKAETKWIFLSDMDHMLIPEVTEKIFHKIKRFNDDYFYTFTRVDAPNMTPYKDHPNSYLMTKALYNKVGGYDESFAGHYGTDGHFRRALNHHAKGCVRLDIPIVRYTRDLIPDASTTTLDRKKGRNGEQGRKYRQLATSNLQKGIKPKILSFPWERVL